MGEFLSADEYESFAHFVKRTTRFVHDEQVRQFLETVLKTSTSRGRKMRKDTVLFRAQRGYTLEPHHVGEEDEVEQPGPHPPHRMIPSAEHVGDGRVNPRGIPCLYLATKSDTAVAEVRPWFDSYVSVAQFKVMQDCVVVDCSLDKERGIFQMFEDPRKDPDAATKESCVWGDIAHAFSKPVTPDEPHLDYVPTQILAEAFRGHGYDGIVYRSLLHEDGKNIALFDIAAADLINCGLYQVISVRYNIDQVANPYFRER